jgi:hypothetical protein
VCWFVLRVGSQVETATDSAEIRPQTSIAKSDGSAYKIDTDTCAVSINSSPPCIIVTLRKEHFQRVAKVHGLVEFPAMFWVTQALAISLVRVLHEPELFLKVHTVLSQCVPVSGQAMELSI